MEGVGGSWQSDLQPYIIDQDRVICVWVFVVWVHVWVYEVLQVVVDCMWWNGPCCFGRLLLLTKTTTQNGHKSYLFKCSILTPTVRLTSYVFVSVCMSVCIHTYSYISIWVCLHVIGGGVWVCRNQQPTTIGNRTDVVLSICFSFSVSQVDCLIFVFVGFLMIVWIFFLFFAFAYKKRHFIRRLKVVLEKWSFSFFICTRFFWSFLHVFLCPRVFLHLLYFFLRVFFLLYPFRCLQYFLAFLAFFQHISLLGLEDLPQQYRTENESGNIRNPPASIQPPTALAFVTLTRHHYHVSPGKNKARKSTVLHMFDGRLVGRSFVRFAAWLSEWLLIQWLSIVPILFVCLVGCVFSFLHERKVFVVFLSKRITGKRRNVLCLVAFVYIWTNERTNECVDG